MPSAAQGWSRSVAGSRCTTRSARVSTLIVDQEGGQGRSPPTPRGLVERWSLCLLSELTFIRRFTPTSSRTSVRTLPEHDGRPSSSTSRRDRDVPRAEVALAEARAPAYSARDGGGSVPSERGLGWRRRGALYRCVAAGRDRLPERRVHVGRGSTWADLLADGAMTV